MNRYNKLFELVPFSREQQVSDVKAEHDFTPAVIKFLKTTVSMFQDIMFYSAFIGLSNVKGQTFKYKVKNMPSKEDLLKVNELQAGRSKFFETTLDVSINPPFSIGMDDTDKLHSFYGDMIERVAKRFSEDVGRGTGKVEAGRKGNKKGVAILSTAYKTYQAKVEKAGIYDSVIGSLYVDMAVRKRKEERLDSIIANSWNKRTYKYQFNKIVFLIQIGFKKEF